MKRMFAGIQQTKELTIHHVLENSEEEEGFTFRQ